MTKDILLIGAVFLAAAITLLACLLPAFGLFADSSPPTISRLKASPSPDGKLVATVFAESGGGAAGYCRENVVVHWRGTKFDPTEKLLVDGSYRNVDANWSSARQLEVSYTHAHQASNRRPSTKGIQVVYKKK